jgi:hypothetical protein
MKCLFEEFFTLSRMTVQMQLAVCSAAHLVVDLHDVSTG